jgi:hypothetical protein
VTIFGSDISHYDGADTRSMFADGIVFQTHKAGGDSDDPELGQWWGYAKSYRTSVLLGAYWVLYPGNPAGRADAFIARLDAACPGWRDGPFILQADCEKWNGNAATVPSVAEINAFCDRLVAKLPKLRPVGYLPDWVYGDISAFKYPLWSSKYVTGSGHYRALYPGDIAKQWAGYGGRNPSILQYSSSATIDGQTTCDANAFRGSLAELTALLAPGWAGSLEGDMALTEDDLTKIASKVWSFQVVNPYLPAPNNVQPTSTLLRYAPSLSPHTTTHNKVDAVAAAVSQVAQMLKSFTGTDFVDEAAIVSGVLAGLAGAEGAAQTIATAVWASVPPNLATDVAKILLTKGGEALTAAGDALEPNG